MTEERNISDAIIVGVLTNDGRITNTNLYADGEAAKAAALEASIDVNLPKGDHVVLMKVTHVAKVNISLEPTAAA